MRYLSTGEIASAFRYGKTTDDVGMPLKKFLGMILSGIINDNCGSQRINSIDAIGMLQKTLRDSTWNASASAKNGYLQNQ